MKSLWMYVCENPDCGTSYVHGSTRPLVRPPRCHSCGEVRREFKLYAARKRLIGNESSYRVKVGT